MSAAADPRRHLASASRFLRLGVVLLTLIAQAPVAAQAVRSTGATDASLTLGVTTEIASLLRLELGTSRVSFDLASDDRDGGASRACLLGRADDAQAASTPGEPVRFLPGGTSFDATRWPDIVLEGGSDLRDFPPPADAESIVCYATFELRPFATVAQWRLTATRFDLPDIQPLEGLYLGGGCEISVPEGLIPVTTGETVTLASVPSDAPCDVLRAVIAVKITDLAAIDAGTGLRYSLLSTTDLAND